MKKAKIVKKMKKMAKMEKMNELFNETNNLIEWINIIKL
jgi:hypothetical protein